MKVTRLVQAISLIGNRMEIFFVFIIALVTIGLFVSEKVSVDVVALLALSALLCLGIVTPHEGTSGFSSGATITVAAMFVLSCGLQKTGIVNLVAQRLIKLYNFNFSLSLLMTMVGVGVLSAFMNNTPVVAFFIPVALGLSKQLQIAPSRLLMPISFASMFGGMCTLIGSSTNLLVSATAEEHGLAPFGLFEFSSLGLIFFFAGVAYMMLVGTKAISKRGTMESPSDRFGFGTYATEIKINESAPWIGKQVIESPIVSELNLRVLTLRRADIPHYLPPKDIVLREGDILKVTGDIPDIERLKEFPEITIRALTNTSTTQESTDSDLVEAVVAPYSALVGKKIRNTLIEERLGASVLGLRHKGRVMKKRLANTFLKAGDVLLLQVPKQRLSELRESDMFVFTAQSSTSVYRYNKSLLALFILFGVVVFAVLGIAPILSASIVGAVLMIVTGCITAEEAYKAIHWRVIFLLAGLIPLGIALEKTGAATLISETLLGSVEGLGVSVIVGVFYLLSSVLTQLMSNNATAILLSPIAIVTAGNMGLDPRMLLLTITFAASASFMTPIGYQTNLMIYEAGDFKFRDFLIVGTPLTLVFFLLTVIFIPKFWGL